MAFNPQEFQKHMDDMDKNLTTFGQQGTLNNIKEDFKGMTADERREAFQIMVEHNQNHDTKLTIDGNLMDPNNNFQVKANTNIRILGGAFGSRVVERESKDD